MPITSNSVNRRALGGLTFPSCTSAANDSTSRRVLSIAAVMSACGANAGARSQYLQPRPREMRALVVSADGPTPSRPAQPLSTIIPDGQPAVCRLELGENYLRIIGEHSPPLADLYYHFHWEHMQAGEVTPAQVPGVPESWRCLRLVFHEQSSLTLCGTRRAIRRLRDHAVGAGATPVA